METLEGSPNFTHFHVELWDVWVIQGIPLLLPQSYHYSLPFRILHPHSQASCSDIWWSGGGIVPVVVIATTPSATSQESIPPTLQWRFYRCIPLHLPLSRGSQQLLKIFYWTRFALLPGTPRLEFDHQEERVTQSRIPLLGSPMLQRKKI